MELSDHDPLPSPSILEHVRIQDVLREGPYENAWFALEEQRNRLDYAVARFLHRVAALAWLPLGVRGRMDAGFPLSMASP
ncbi:MAG: DUF3991 domain-containing protein [Alphaproteobacteria bacterium]|nr:DUF3991 domain-containing protein [Alphaproteobacteria bacterium]